MGIDIEITKNFIKSQIKNLKKSVSDDYIAGELSAYRGILDFIMGQEQARQQEEQEEQEWNQKRMSM